MTVERTPRSVTTTQPSRARSTVGAATLATAIAVLVAGAPQAAASESPAAPKAPAATAVNAARAATTAPGTLDSLARFFARDGAVARAKAQPRIEGATVPVYTLAPGFVADASGADRAPIAKLDFLASKALSADGQVASVWTAHTGGSWKVVNIATGGDETYYVAKGAKKLAGGTVFREPQIDAWYVQRGARVLPLDADAERAVGARGTTVDAYRERVHKAYADKLPGSQYAKKGEAGGYGPRSDAAPPTDARPADGARDAVQHSATASAGDEGLLTATSALTALAALVALGLSGAVALRLRRR
ncbi:hypothetical protein [Streptomyces buecherae]|uniref:hypothetical protein n=1 Tax=Streptomyces buecherae TaxID=2763006 RepID=UPI0020B69172|nr:hypothetical protein [Streptomyces buecherae]